MVDLFAIFYVTGLIAVEVEDGQLHPLHHQDMEPILLALLHIL